MIAISVAPKNMKEYFNIIRNIHSNECQLIELCIDNMSDIKLDIVRKKAKIPHIISCRSLKEGGNYFGDEIDRIDLLQQAINLKFHFVDIEIDSLYLFEQIKNSKSKIILSKHDLNQMPNFELIYSSVKANGHKIKIVGRANLLKDVFQVFEILKKYKDITCIALGEKGLLTRLLASYFNPESINYIPINSEHITASGQKTLYDMISKYKIDKITPHTYIIFQLYINSIPEINEELLYFYNNELELANKLEIGLMISELNREYYEDHINKIFVNFNIKYHVSFMNENYR